MKRSSIGLIRRSAIVLVSLSLIGISSIVRPPKVAAAIEPLQTYTYRDWPATTTGYNSFEWFLRPGAEGNPGGYFWANQFGFVNGAGGYFGLQNQGNGPTGKIAIFSIWDSIAVEGPQYTNTFGGEGTGYTARISYPWKVGENYRMRVARAETGWWKAWIRNESTKAESYVGRIQVPESWLGLAAGNNALFTELYLNRPETCEEIPYTSALFTNFTANWDVTIKPTIVNLFNNSSCTNSRITSIPGGVRHEMGINNPHPGPKTTLTSPVGGSYNRGTITLSSTASSPNGVRRVDYYIDDKKVATDETAPYRVSIDTTQFSNGEHKIRSWVTDYAGETSGNTVTIARFDNQAPSSTITGITNGASVKGLVTIGAQATDHIRMARVEFYRNNTLIRTDYSSPWCLVADVSGVCGKWDTKSVPNGTYTFYALAIDSAGNTKKSTEVKVTVKN